MKKNFLLFVTSALLFSGVSFAQTGKDAGKAKRDLTVADKKDSTAAAKKPMPKQCPGKTCGKKKD